MDLQRRAAFLEAMGLGPIWCERDVSSRAQEVAAFAAGEPHDAALQYARAKSPMRVQVNESSTDAPGETPAGDARAALIEKMDWASLTAAVSACTACGLCRSRTQTVFGVGHQDARWMVVGEAPGAEEDARGEPFVGQAGRLLDNMLAAVGLSRHPADPADQSAVYIANVLKCRPPGNRNPEPSEVALCEPFLQRQIALVRPALILVMGRFAAQALLATDATIASLRGRAHQIKSGATTVPVVVTYHPAYLLRNLADKSKAWADLCLARELFQRLSA